jgi:MFS superfamily sulfate permease-like transporter
LVATFGLALIEDLTVGIIAGCVLAAAFAVFDRGQPAATSAFPRNARL